MLTQNVPACSMRGHAREVFAGQNSTIGGSSETLVNDWQVRPTGSPSDIAVTTVTPVANRPRVSRKCRAATGSWTGLSSPGRYWKPKSPCQDSASHWLGQVSSLTPAALPGSAPRGRTAYA